jgi:hypothetical protein
MSWLARIVFCLSLSAAIWLCIPERVYRSAPGILSPNPPMQREHPPKVIAQRDGFEIAAVADFSLEARVLGTKRYRIGPDVGLAPIDIGVGWAKMSDQRILDQFSLSMGNRFFFYSWKDRPPLPEKEIMVSMANIHAIAADGSIADRIAALRTGELIILHGKLVNVKGPKGFKWNSSLRRDDTGNGACEVCYVTGIWAEPPPKG